MVNDPGERTRFIEHRGTEILLYDFAGFTDLDDALRSIHASRTRILGRAPKSVLTLVNVKDSRVEAAKDWLVAQQDRSDTRSLHSRFGRGG